MTFEVNEQEAKKLIHLIGLGNDVINEYRDSKDQKPEYAELTHRLMEQYLQQKTPEFTMCHYIGYKEDIESVEDSVRTDCSEYIKAYEKAFCRMRRRNCLRTERVLSMLKRERIATIWHTKYFWIRFWNRECRLFISPISILRRKWKGDIKRAQRLKNRQG